MIDYSYVNETVTWPAIKVVHLSVHVPARRIYSTPNINVDCLWIHHSGARIRQEQIRYRQIDIILQWWKSKPTYLCLSDIICLKLTAENIFRMAQLFVPGLNPCLSTMQIQTMNFWERKWVGTIHELKHFPWMDDFRKRHWRLWKLFCLRQDFHHIGELYRQLEPLSAFCGLPCLYMSLLNGITREVVPQSVSLNSATNTCFAVADSGHADGACFWFSTTSVHLRLTRLGGTLGTIVSFTLSIFAWPRDAVRYNALYGKGFGAIRNSQGNKTATPDGLAW